MTFRKQSLGNFVQIEKGLTYKGDRLIEDSEVALIGMDSFIPGGGYKAGSEKPYSGPYKAGHTAEAGDLILCATDVTQDGSVLSAPLLVPEDLGGYETLVYSHHVCKVKVVNPGIRREFIYNFFRIPLNRVRCAYGDTGTTVRALPYEVIYDQRIPVPSLEEQDRINSFIATLDHKIQLNTSMAETLEKIAQSVFKSWFIDFDPVKAKMAGENPVGMDDATAALFPDSMEESALGQIPIGWSVQEFGEVNHLLMGQSPPGDTYNSEGEGVPFYQGRTDFGTRFPKQRVFCTAGTRFARAGEVLISVRAPVGDLNQAIEDCVIGRGVASAMHKSGSQAYSYSLLCSLKPRLAYYNGEGTVFGAINRADFYSLKIVEPPRQVVDSFETIAGPFNDEIRNLFIQTESLIELRDSLLPRLISGELKLSDEILTPGPTFQAKGRGGDF
jgi:type I restriction enzyme S subunit